MTAADILRERARNRDRMSDLWGLRMNDPARDQARLMHATADLMAACIEDYDRDGTQCAICGGWAWPEEAIKHKDTCPLAALERLIQGERGG